MPRPVADLTCAMVVDTIEASKETRTISGVAVPWGKVGYTSAGPVRFEAGSLEGNPILLRDHDRTKGIGVVSEQHDDGERMNVRTRISATALGDETLTLAADGVLRGFSVGVRPTKYRFEEDAEHGEVLVVEAGEWKELSILPFQAFSDATVTKVAASAPETKETPVETTATPAPVVQATETVPTPEPKITVKAHRPSVGQMAHLMVLAQQGDPRAVAFVTEAIKAEVAPADLVLAALTGSTTGAGNIGILPPSYSSEILDGLPVVTPFLDNLCRKTGLPATGMSIIKPTWTTKPDGGWVTQENTQPPTGAVSITTKTVSVETYAHAVLASLNLVNRSDFGGFASAYYSQVAIDYLGAKEAKAVETAQGVATPVSLAGETTVQGAIGRLVAAQIANQLDTSKPSPEFRGLLPEYAAVAPDLWSVLVETKALDGPAFSSGSIEWGRLTGSLSGLIVVMVPALATGKFLVGARAAMVVHDGSEVEMRALVVNTLSMELGFMANAAFDVEYPKALVKGQTAFTPSALAAPAKSK